MHPASSKADFLHALNSPTEKLMCLQHKPVQQAAMHEGDIELF